MATIIIENVREHDITLHAPQEGGTVQATIPAAKQSDVGNDSLIHGSAEIEESIIDAAKKSSAVVRHYFDEGWLRIKSAAKQGTKRATE